MKALAKRLATRLLPEKALVALKERWYAREVRRFAEPDVVPLESLVRKGEFVVDAGANLGWYTALLSELVGPAGRVLAVEAVPATHALLTRVLRRIGAKNVRAVGCALSDAPGTVEMELPRHDGEGDHYLARMASAEGEGSAERFRVEAKTLDALVAAEGAHRCAFVKCDVEGHELAVLRGARRTLESDRPALLLESSGSEENRRAIAALLEGLGYAPWWFDGTHLRPKAPGDAPVNFLWLQPAQLERLATLVRDGAAA